VPFVASTDQWTYIKPRQGARLTVEEVGQLLADWRRCARELERLPPGPERDAMAERFDELADAYQQAFEALLPRQS
jgi:hypothetical protein